MNAGLSPRRRLAREGAAYAVVAGLCLALHNAVMIAVDWLGGTLVLAVASSFGVVAITGYLLHSRLTFREAIGLSPFLRYVWAMALNLPLAYGATWLWRGWAHLPMVWAAPLGSLMMVAVNFLLSRWAIKSGRPPKG